jgi:hypothetical protein
MPKFKDYEYGWYGFACGFGSKFMDMGTCEFAHQWYEKDQKYFDRSNYEGSIDNRRGKYYNVKRQLPKLKGVVFIYGDYKDCI